MSGKLEPLSIAPGLYTIATDRGAAGRWKDGDKVRFRHGMPEKIGGWLKSGILTFLGKCRKLIDWRSLSFEKFIGIGTHLKLYVWKGGAYYNITPIRASGTLAADPIDTTDGSAVVNISHTAHGIENDGTYVTFGGATAVGGITIDGEYTVTEIIDTDNYTITHSSAATSTATGGGAAVTYSYEIDVGAEHSEAGLGWGAGPWDGSTWGTPRTISNFLTGARVWSLDTWGEDLIAAPRDGGIYVWDTSVGTGTRATIISGAPTEVKQVMVSPENRHLIAFGAHNGVALDPLLIRWATSEDYTGWTPSSTNSAGQKRLDTGNTIVCGVKARKEVLVFTDSHLWAMQFIGPPNTFGWENIGENGGIRGPNAAIEVGGITYWMGKSDFFYYSGSVNVLACDVHPTVFKDINYIQGAKVYAAYNRDFGELMWLYCSAESTECDRYVLFNIEEKLWSFGTLVRTAFVGNSDIFATPYATGTDGYLYDHDTGTDDDTSAMSASLESGDVEIGNGDMMMFVDKFVPDFKTLTGSVDIRLRAKKYPQSTSYSSDSGQLEVLSTTEFVKPRVKGRQVTLSITSDALGDAWRMGTNRVGIRAYGKK
jgi:hypothetical protein